MGKPSIKILDSVHCKANKSARELILPCLAYEERVYRRTRFGSKQSTKTQYLITGRIGTSGTFLTGLLPRIKDYCKKQGHDIKILGRNNIERVKPTHGPKLKGIEFREDQKNALMLIKKKYRGNIVATTGSGKTIVANGIFSMFTKSSILFLCHTTDILNQTCKSIKKYLPDRTYFAVGGGRKTDWKQIKRHKKDAPIVVATIQTFSNLNPTLYADFFDITIVDEVHHVNSKKSQYGNVMELNLSPRKYGLTATEPKKQREALTNEGFFGPIIFELNMDEAIEKGINAKPVVNLVPVPYDPRISDECGKVYKKLYQQGIVENSKRNKLIYRLTRKSIRKKEVTLIIIEKTMHGKILQSLFSKNGLEIPFVYGKTPKDERERVKEDLKNEKIKCAICSRVWREGTNIPSLRHIINAHGMKEEKIIIQAMGRGLRTFKDKKFIKLSDFLDPYHHLANHAILRIQIYINQGWL
jgi:superfamily II DNA or RNA helicase